MFPYSPSGIKLKFVVAAFSHNCWVSHLCATQNFGKIGSQAATPPSLREKNYFHETIIVKLNGDLHFRLHLTASRGGQESIHFKLIH